MKFLEILRFEIDDKLRRPSTWFFFTAFIGLAYFITSGMLAGEAERDVWNRLLWFGIASLTLFSLRGCGVPA